MGVLFMKLKQFQTFCRENARLLLALGAVCAFCAVLPVMFAVTAIPTGSWGLSFRTEGQPPVGNASVGALRQYDAVYVGDTEEKVLYLTFDAGHPGDVHFALRVRGESMLNAGILPGDLVVVRQQQTCNQGEIVVAMIDDEATVKRFSRKNGHVWLLPENDDYEPIDGTYAQILGKVVAVVRQY